jgi:hypothetical protein
MLKFFRNIRRTLLSDNKKGKYLKYAIGEVILVMVGILLALQVNNWNENLKERVIEKELIVELIITVKTNHELVTSGIKRWQYTKEMIEFITHVIDDQLPYVDSLSRYFYFAHQQRGSLLNALDYSGYKSLENRGYDLLRNRELRKEVIYLFENHLNKLANVDDQLDFDNSGFHYEYITQNFTIDGIDETPHNFNDILNDRFYYSILKKLENSLDRKINKVKRFLDNNRQVLQLLEEELDESH